MRTDSMFRAWLAVGFLWATAGLSEPASPVTPELNGKTLIRSKELTFDYKARIAEFKGEVDVTDPQVRIKADQATVCFDTNNTVRSVSASGNVRIWQEDKTATCTRAVYNLDAGEVMLAGKARLMRGKDAVMGNVIRFWINEERMECKPGTLLIFPKSKDEQKTAAGGGSDDKTILDILKK